MLRLLMLTAALLMALPASAAENLGRSGDWHAFRETENNEPVCYMVTHPATPARKAAPVKKTSKTSKTPLPREPALTITFRPSESLLPVFSYTAGVILKDNAEAVVTAGDRKFSLFNARDGAWARTGPVDQALTKAARKEKFMDVRTRTAKGKILNDKFSLKGSENAYRKIAQACGIP
jgi:hypothetical protein